MTNATAIKKVIDNQNDLEYHIDAIQQLTDKEVEIKALYHEQIHLLKVQYRNKQLSKEEYQKKISETKKVYQKYRAKIKELLDMNYSIAVWQYEQDNVLKAAIDYQKLKQDYQANLATIKEQKVEQQQFYEKMKRRINSKYLIFLLVIATISLLVISLLVNYLFYFKTANQSQTFSFTVKNHLIAFIFACIGIILIISFLAFFIFKVRKRLFLDKDENLLKVASVAYGGSFADTIGVGSFAVTVAGLNAIKSVKNVKKLPGTLNIGLTIPNIFAGTLFVSAIEVELVTLITLVSAAIIGAFTSSRFINKVNKKFIALIVAICLAIAGILMILAQVELFASAGTKGLSGWKLAVGIISFFLIGGLQSFGVGLYAPALAIVSLLGMEAMLAFPIMTCASGFAMPATAWSFHRDNNYSPKVAFGLTLGGVFGTVSAFFIVFVGIQGGLQIQTKVFTYYLKWFAIAVMYYAAFMLFKRYLDARKEMVPQQKVRQKGVNPTHVPELFEQKIAQATEFKAFNAKNFQEKMSNNNINLLKWR